MNLIFMGTPNFSIPSLKKLTESKHNVVAVVTALDKERGRGRKVTFTPVKEFAIQKNIPVLQPEKLKNNPQFVNDLKLVKADLCVVVAFKILPPVVFEIPKNGSFNLHASYLPKYRGAAPIQWALINGEQKTGLTTFKLAEKVDTGNIYLQKEVEIFPEDNFGILHDKLSELGADLVLETVDLIESVNYELIKQDGSLATPAPKITKEICEIDWNKSAEEIHNLIRGLSPYPAAFFIFKEKVIKIYKAELVHRDDLKPFEIVQNKCELIIGCDKDAIRVLQLQQEGKKRMGAEEFLRGFSFI
ncbi:MAG: methionyl-tRNA formyltransferase [Ignavibacteria bacterium]|nr:methionyl-tRNA formyltransferase [Ignavibacteria bacterium]MBT8382426.1 methionyl-tRNA formyltransferase [Ignavibacteria bacterium]MBT8390182.1 methionyl-tRNA formyltransferase [Ignavibacteria bacterium]NNJ52779.1 methionyl-tRNA formyltransferase [Ignavibacteriaceae bacterium]NNL20361.1 methionyl-tRNA formyltransferase [Ignavibacteriaceae bacterium]